MPSLVDYDDSPWNDEEKTALAAEAGELGWDEMDEYDERDAPQES